MEDSPSSMDWQQDTPPALSSMDWQQDTPPAVYIAPTRPFLSQSSPTALKRPFANYDEDLDAPQGPEAVDDTWARNDFHTGTRAQFNNNYERKVIYTGNNANEHWERNGFHVGNNATHYWERNEFLARTNTNTVLSDLPWNRSNHESHQVHPQMASTAPLNLQHQQDQPSATATSAQIDPYFGRPLSIQYSVRFGRQLAAEYTAAKEEAKTLAIATTQKFREFKDLTGTTNQRVRNLTMTTKQHVRHIKTTAVSTWRHGAARAGRLAQRNRRRAHNVYTCAVQAAQAAKRRCMQFTVPRREPAPVIRRPVTPPATAQRSPRRSPSHFTSGRINAENDSKAKEAAAVDENDDWLTNFLPTPTITDLELQKAYEVGDDDFMMYDFMSKTRSVNMDDHMKSSPLSERSITNSPVAVSPVQPITNSPTTSLSAELATSPPAFVSPMQSLTYPGTNFSFTVPTIDSTVTASPIKPIACSPTTFSSAASTTDSPVTVSDASLFELSSPAAVPSARKSSSPAIYQKKTPGVARHFQKTPKKSVGFFASPRTGKPVSRIESYVIGEPIGYPLDSASGSSSTISSCSSSFLREYELIDSPVILEDIIGESSGVLGTHQHSDVAAVADSTSDSPPDTQSLSNSISIEEPVTNANEDLNTYEHRDWAVTAHHDILRPIHNGGTVITRPRSPTNLVITDLGSPIKVALTSLVPSLRDQVACEVEVMAVSKQHDERSNKENKSPSTAQPDQSQHLEEQSVLPSSPRPEQIVEQPATPVRQHDGQGDTQGGRPSDDPVTPVRLNEDFAGLSVSVRRTSTRQQLRREAEQQRKVLQAAKEAEEKAARERVEEEAREAAEEERKQKLTRRIPVGKVIQPLSSEWEDRVAQTMALADGHEVATTSTGTKLFRKDLGTLLPQAGRDSASGWLNDEIIAAYLQAVVDHGLAATDYKKGQTPKYYAFNTFFYKNIRDKGPDSVKRWATKAKIGGKNLESVERILIPVHEGMHWTLLVVSPVLKTIEYFDSLGGSPERYVANAKAWLAQEMGRAWNEADWEVIDSTSPQQDNSKDCGVFTVTTAKMVVLGVDPLAYGCADIPVQRKRMVAELMNGGFTAEFEPRL